MVAGGGGYDGGIVGRTIKGKEPEVVAHTCNPRTSGRLKTAWATA